MLIPFGMSSAVEAKVRHRHQKTPVVATQTVNYVQSESAMDFMIKERVVQGEVAPVRASKKIVNHSYQAAQFTYMGSRDLVSKASQYMGASARQLGLPSRLWCADFMNMVTRSGTDRRAFSYLHRGSPASYGCTNCIAVTKRRGGGHVGVVTGYDGRGNPITISGNHGRRVGEGVYNKRIVIAYRYI